MDLGLTRRGDYVVRAALDLASRFPDGQWHKADSLAASTSIPMGYVRQILRMLVRGGIAQAHSGTSGGYRLQRDPGTISLLEVVEMGEGPLVSKRCVLRGTGCTPETPCPLHPAFKAAQDALRAELSATTLQSILHSGVQNPGAPRRPVGAR